MFKENGFSVFRSIWRQQPIAFSSTAINIQTTYWAKTRLSAIRPSLGTNWLSGIVMFRVYFLTCCISRMKRFLQVSLNCQNIMFQGDNPSTDLRGVGFLGLIQPLYFVTTPELLGLSKAIYKLSLSDKQDFPLMVLSINVTRIALHALRDDLLARYSSNLICNIQ